MATIISQCLRVAICVVLFSNSSWARSENDVPGWFFTILVAISAFFVTCGRVVQNGWHLQKTKKLEFSNFPLPIVLCPAVAPGIFGDLTQHYGCYLPGVDVLEVNNFLDFWIKGSQNLVYVIPFKEILNFCVLCRTKWNQLDHLACPG